MKVRLEMKTYNMILIEKLQKIHAYHVDKHEYLTAEKILPSDQQQIIKQAIFTYSPLGEAFEKRKKKKNLRSRRKRDKSNSR